MSFMFPLGFLALLGIPVLILIYIIKNRYTEQVISSTYIWTLSEKFLKRRIPISRIAGIISLILQILIVVLVSFAIAHPVFTVRNSANDFCFILDGSGSMNITYDGKTRLERGKDEIRGIVNGTLNGSTYTLLYANGEMPELACSPTGDKETFFGRLDEIEPSYGNVSDEKALTVAQEYFDENPALKIYYITDVTYDEVENVEIINVAKNEQNYALSNVKANLNKTAKTLAVSAQVISYESDATLTVGMFVDDAQTATKAASVKLNKGELVSFSFETANNIESYDKIRVSIMNDDGLALDSQVIHYSVDTANGHTALIVSSPHANGSNPAFFLKNMLGAMGNLDCEVVTADEYSPDKPEMSGKDLYVFDGYIPAALPENGATWFVNPTGNLAGTNFTYQGIAEPNVSGLLKWSDDMSKSLDPVFKEINRDNPDEIIVSRYVKCGISRDFDIILTHDKNPVVFTGRNAYGNNETVFAFDMNSTPGVITGDFLILVRNLINTSFPEVITETDYICGEVMDINVLSGCDSITVTSPSGKIKSLDTDTSVTSYTLAEVGVHNVTVKYLNGEVKEFSVFAALPEEERIPSVSAQSFVLSGEASDGYRDGTYDDLLYLFIAIAVIAMADWMVYCYEQYQLR